MTFRSSLACCGLVHVCIRTSMAARICLDFPGRRVSPSGQTFAAMEIVDDVHCGCYTITKASLLLCQM